MSPPSQVSALRIACEYVRVSLDRSGRERSVREQHVDNSRAAAQEGWTLGRQYRDNSVSASRYSRKVRTGFADLMADLEEGRFEGDVLIVWESSRASRRTGEWVDLVEVCRERGVLLHITKDGITYDPGRGRDHKALLSDAIDSEYESSKVSERTKRSSAANAGAGKPHGRIPFGYRRVYDSQTKELVAQEPDPEEAPVVRELFARIVAGESLRGIAKRFEERGIRTRSGGSFSGAALRSMAVRESYAGLRVHDPGRTTSTVSTSEARVVPGTWEPLVSEEQFYAAKQILSDPGRRTNRPGRGKHLLGMIARCDVCAGVLVATQRDNRGEQYQCQNGGHVRVSKEELDDVAKGAILGYLAQAHVAFDTDGVDQEQLAAARAEVEKVRVELNDLADAVGKGVVSVTLAARSEPMLRERLSAAEGRTRELATPSRLRGLVPDSFNFGVFEDRQRLMVDGSGRDATQVWEEDLTTAARREIARIVLAPGLAGELRVTRSPTPGKARTPAGDRVRWRE